MDGGDEVGVGLAVFQREILLPAVAPLAPGLLSELRAQGLATVVVSATFPGANAETLAETVAAPLEESINGVENMLYLTSSSSNGLAQVTVTFKPGTDLDAAQVLAAFDAQARLVEIAPRVAYVCKDADDQKFIDLAAAHRAILLSKDKAVLACRKRLLALGIAVQPHWP